MEPPPRKYVQLFFQKLNQLLAPNLSLGTKSLETFGRRAGVGVVILSHYSVHSASLQEVKGFFSRKEGKITKNDLYWIHSIWIIIYICHTEINPARSCVQEFFLVIFYNRIWIALCTNRSLANDNGLPYVRIGRRWPIKKKCHFQRHFSWERRI